MKQMFLAAVIAVWGVTGAQAQDADIRAVITQQFDAFKVDDFATAFTFASPLRLIFLSCAKRVGPIGRRSKSPMPKAGFTILSTA